MKVYLKDLNIYWLDEPLENADAEWDINEIQESILRNGGTANYRDGKLIIIPAAPETVEQSTNVITKREFISRMTSEEFATIKGAAAANAVVDYYWQLFMVSDEIDLAFTATVAGLTLLEQAGLLAAGRAAEILS